MTKSRLATAALLMLGAWLAPLALPAAPEQVPPRPPGARPAWIREGIVGASDMESTSFVLRRGGQPADFLERRAQDRSEEAARRLQAIGVNLLIINLMKGAGLKAEADDIEEARKFTQVLHRHGIKVAGYIGGTIFYEQLAAEEPGAADWRQVDEWNRPIYYNPEQTFRYMACRNNPGYQAFIQKVLRKGIQDLKLDAIHFDQVMAWPEPSTCRCRYCRAQFREFLEARYRDPELRRMRFGFFTLEGAAPPPYNQPSGPPVRLSELRNPLMQEWALFRAASVAKRFGEYDSYIYHLNPEVAVISNPSMYLEANVGYIYGIDLQQLAQHGDIVCDEEGNNALWTQDGRLVSKIRAYKAARAMGKSLWTWQVSPGPQPYREPVQLRLAEALAFNDANLGLLAGYDVGGNQVEPEVQRYIDFFREHSSDLRHSTPIADAAVLRSFSSIEFNPVNGNFNTLLFEQTLIQSQIPFGMVFDRHLKDLSNYKVLVLAGQEALDDEQVALIRAWVNAGGGLVATGNTATMTGWRQRRGTSALSTAFGIDTSSTTPVRAGLGAGRVVYLPGIDAAVPPPAPQMTLHITNRYWKLPRNYVEMAEAVKWASGDRLSATLEAPPSVAIELARSANGKGLLLHLLNFNLDKPVDAVPVTLRVPAGMQLQRATLHAPGSASQALKMAAGAGSVSFTVPIEGAYSLVVLK